MTHMPVRVNPDGSRTYSNRYTYHPVKPEDRKYGGRKYNKEEGEWWGSHWLAPFAGSLAEPNRTMPETRADYNAYLHVYGCWCDVCKRPTSLWWKRQKRPGVTLVEVNLVIALSRSRTQRNLRDAETEG